MAQDFYYFQNTEDCMAYAVYLDNLIALAQAKNSNIKASKTLFVSKDGKLSIELKVSESNGSKRNCSRGDKGEVY